MHWGTWLAFTTDPLTVVAEGGGNRTQFRSYVRTNHGIRDFEICARVTFGGLMIWLHAPPWGVVGLAIIAVFATRRQRGGR